MYKQHPVSINDIVKRKMSPNQANIYSQCGLRWLFMYHQNNRLPKLVSVSMGLGVAFDDAISKYLLDGMNGDVLSDTDITDIAFGKYIQYCCEHEIPAVTYTPLAAELPRMVSQYTDTFGFNGSNPVIPIDVQVTVSCELDTEYGKVPITGRIDFIGMLHGVRYVVDIKTSRLKIGEHIHAGSAQLQSYAWMTGIPDVAILGIHTNSKHPPVMHLYYYPDTTNYVTDRYQNIIRGAVNNAYHIPNSPDVCNPYTCVCFEHCPFGAASR